MNIWDRIKFAASWIFNFLKPTIKMFAKKAGRVLANVAIEIVTEIAKDPKLLKKSGEEKRKAAYERIEKRLIDESIAIGVEVTTSMINEAIEIAYRNLQEGE